MKIKKIVLKNYRQYMGEQTIKFSTYKDKNLTIVIGINGAGKTNLLNAITWCLYGREGHLAESSAYYPMCNDSVRASLKLGEVAEASVETFFEDENSGDEFRISREAKFRKTKEDSLSALTENSCAWMKIPPSQDWKEGDASFLVHYRILPSGVKDFFFFDGEQLIKLFEEETADKVRSAILDVSQISLMNTTIKHLEDKKSELMKEIGKFSPKTRELSEKREAFVNGLKELEEEIKRLEENKKEVERLLKEIDGKLRGYSEERVRELRERSERLEGDIKDVDERKRSLYGDFTKLIIEDGPFCLAGKALGLVMKSIKEKYRKGELPPRVKATFLRELLERGRCICGTDIKRGKGRQKIKRELENSAIATKLDENVSSIRYGLNVPLERGENFLKTKLNLGTEIKKLEIKRNQLREELEGVRARLKELKIEKIESLINQKEDYEGQKEDLSDTLSKKRYQKENSGRVIKELEDDLKKESRKEEKLNTLRKKIEICEGGLSFLQEVKEEILGEVRSSVERKTFEYFHELIWKKKKFRDVKIDENYVVDVIDRYGHNIIGGISSGEREILALSFMASLRGISGFEAPIVIDTPLARISGEHRANIAKCLPRYLKDVQIIILLTDEEYTKNVEKILAPRVGCEYLLDYNREKDETAVKKYGK